MSEVLYRPKGVDGTTWSRIRKGWIEATESGRTVEARTQLASSIGMTFKRLQRWAKRCGWPGVQRHNRRTAL
jgi:hypothetical protein